MADGSIIIDTHIDNAQAQKELGKLRKDIVKLQSALGKKTTEQSAIAKEMQQADAAIEETYQNIKRLEAELASLEGVNLKDNTSAEVFAAQSRIPQIKAELEQQYAALEKQGAAGEKAAASYDKITAEVNELSAKLEEATIKAGRLAQEINGGGGAEAPAKAMKRATTETQKFSKRIRGLAASALIFSVLTKALTAMREWLARTAAASEEASAAFASFKGTLQGLAAPILNAVLPALIKIVRVITQIISLISRGVSALFGMTNKQALASAESLNAQKDALDGVGGAASDAEKQLASFDEINKLTEPGGGGGGIDTDGVSFEEVELPMWMVAAAERLSAAFGKLRDAVNEIKENPAFQKIRDFVEKMVELGGAAIVNGIAKAVEALANTIDLLNSVLSGDFKTAWPQLKELLTYNVGDPNSAPNWATSIATGQATTKLSTWIHSLLTSMAIKKWWTNDVVPYFSEKKWKGQWDNVKTAFETKWGEIETWWKNSALVMWFNNDVKPWFTRKRWERLWSDVKLGVQNGWNAVKTWWQNSAIVVWWNENVTPWFTKARWEQLWSDVKQGFSDGWAAVVTWWDTTVGAWWDDNVAIWFTAAKWSGLWSEVESGFDEGWAAIVLWWDTAVADWWDNNVSVWFTADKWSSIMGGIGSAFSSAFNSAANAAIRIINGMISKINDALKVTMPSWDLMDTIGLSAWKGRTLSLGSIPSIPYLAQGAVIPPNQAFMAVLGDQKSGTNIETPLSTMVQAFRQALNEGGRGGQRTIVLEVDKRELGRVTFDLYNAEAQRIGVSLGGA